MKAGLEIASPIGCYRSERREDHIFLQLAAGSAENLKPELVMDAFGAFAGITISEHALLIHRLELYADTGMDGERRLACRYASYPAS